VRDASTLADVRPVELGPRPVWRRRILVGLLLVLVLAGAAGLLGGRSTTTSASAGNDTLSVAYPRTARAGLDVPLTIDLHRAGGFTGPITIRVSSGYLQIFDVHGFSPQPASQSADEDHLYWTFTPPPAGEDFRLDLNASVMPSSQSGSTGQIAVLVDGAPTVAVDTETWLAP
jgi:hypothetical protein